MLHKVFDLRKKQYIKSQAQKSVWLFCLRSEKSGVFAVEYNHLNLPRKVTYSNGNWIEWTYDANGTKLKKTTSAGDTKHYINGIEYDGTVIEAIYHAEGRASLQGSTYRYEYTLRDHPEVNSGQALGNSRVMFADLNSDNEVDETEILQQNHYYLPK
jgi:hypothetical protein